MPYETTTTDAGAGMFASLTAMWAMFLAAVPKIIGFLLILVIGWLLASLIQKAIAGLLRTVHFNNLARRSGLSGFVQQMGVDEDASSFIGHVAKWFVRLIALVVAFDALGLPAVSSVLRQLLLWLPNLVVAVIVLVIGGIAANALANLVRASTAQAGFRSPDAISKVARVLVWAFAIVVAVNQLGIAETLVNTLFMAFMGALALAAGLAFGLGGRETAAQIWRDMYERTKANAPKLQRAAEAANEMTSGSPEAAERARDYTPDRGRDANPLVPPPIPRRDPGGAFGDD